MHIIKKFLEHSKSSKVLEHSKSLETNNILALVSRKYSQAVTNLVRNISQNTNHQHPVISSCIHSVGMEHGDVMAIIDIMATF